MAIGIPYLELLAASILEAFPRDHLRPLKAVGLGYPDLVLSFNDLRTRFPNLASAQIQPDSRKNEILAAHRLSETDFTALDTQLVFRSLGLDPVFVDIVQDRGVEQILDLNKPIPAELEQNFDVVVDPGTLEHCFNVGQAFKNVSAMTKVGGILVMASPLNLYNHGFWNFNPTAYADYFTSNGFKLLYLKGWTGSLKKAPTEFDVYLYKRFGKVPERSTLVCVAQKDEHKENTWPVQSKYQRQ